MPQASLDSRSRSASLGLFRQASESSIRRTSSAWPSRSRLAAAGRRFFLLAELRSLHRSSSPQAGGEALTLALSSPVATCRIFLGGCQPEMLWSTSAEVRNLAGETRTLSTQCKNAPVVHFSTRSVNLGAAIERGDLEGVAKESPVAADLALQC